jgi:predicted PolB exonuclease-like 3'-5' exonuclease
LTGQLKGEVVQIGELTGQLKGEVVQIGELTGQLKDMIGQIGELTWSTEGADRSIAGDDLIVPVNSLN